MQQVAQVLRIVDNNTRKVEDYWYAITIGWCMIETGSWDESLAIDHLLSFQFLILFASWQEKN